ncbi:MAG: hypothetical protein GY767_13990 [Shimia sp.]|nr:hypothetical protein [Shimia sp.]
MANKTAQQITEKFRQKMAAAGGDFEFGVNNPSRSWEEGAREGASRWATGVQEAIGRDAFSKGVAGKDSKWQRKVTTVGVQRYTAAAQSAAEEYGRVAQTVLEIAQASSAQVQSMANSTFEERTQRAVQNMRNIRDAWRQRKGG